MAVLLALITAASYGVGDFSGGLAARRAAPLSVTATAHALGLVGVTLLAAVVGADLVRPADLVLGAAGGACGCLGVVLLYRGLATGRMAVVSPISAVVAAVVPVIGGLVSGERPGGLAVLGIVAALVAIALVSRSGPMGRPDRGSLLVALGSGLGFGVFFLLLSGIHEEAGLWPLAVGRLTSVVIAPETAHTLLGFDLGAALRVAGSDCEEGELWTLYKPRGHSLSVRASGEYVAGRASREGRWRRLPPDAT